MKTADTEKLGAAIRTVARGRAAFTAGQLRRAATWRRQVQTRLDTLTPREWEVLRFIIAGKNNREIAAALSISESTVAKHVSALLSKLHQDSRQKLMAFAVKHHLDA